MDNDRVPDNAATPKGCAAWADDKGGQQAIDHLKRRGTVAKPNCDRPKSAVVNHERVGAGRKFKRYCGAGYRANLANWDIEEPAELAYRIGFNPLHARVDQGNFVEWQQ